MSDSSWPHGLQPTRLLHGIFQTRVLEWGAIAFSERGMQWVQKRAKWVLQDIYFTMFLPLPWAISILEDSPQSEEYSFSRFQGKICCCFVTKSCRTFYNPMDCSLPDFSVHVFSQARILEWVAVSISRWSYWPRDQTCVSCIGQADFFFTTEPPGKPQGEISRP